MWKFIANDEIGWKVTADESGIYFGCKDYHLYHVSHDGRLIWKFRVGGSVISIPFVHEGTVYFGSYDQNLYAISKYTGKLLWRFPTGNMLYGCPIVYEGKVYFGATDNNFYALTMKGELLWKFKIDEHETVGCAAHGGRIYFGSWDCKLRCVSADTGRLIWLFKTSIGRPAETDVEGELGMHSFELTIPKGSGWKSEEGTYKPSQTKEMGDYQTGGGSVYQSSSTYKTRRRYGQ